MLSTLPHGGPKPGVPRLVRSGSDTIVHLQPPKTLSEDGVNEMVSLSFFPVGAFVDATTNKTADCRSSGSDADCIGDVRGVLQQSLCAGGADRASRGAAEAGPLPRLL